MIWNDTFHELAILFESGWLADSALFGANGKDSVWWRYLLTGLWDLLWRWDSNGTFQLEQRKGRGLFWCKHELCWIRQRERAQGNDCKLCFVDYVLFI